MSLWLTAKNAEKKCKKCVSVTTSNWLGCTWGFVIHAVKYSCLLWHSQVSVNWLTAQTLLLCVVLLVYVIVNMQSLCSTTRLTSNSFSSQTLPSIHQSHTLSVAVFQLHGVRRAPSLIFTTHRAHAIVENLGTEGPTLIFCNVITGHLYYHHRITSQDGTNWQLMGRTCVTTSLIAPPT